MDLSREKLAWCAGFFDGEGCTYLNRTNKRTVNIAINITQIHIEVLNRYKKIMGVGVVKFVSEKRHNRNDKYVYIVSNYEGVQHCIAAMWPFLGEVKREQALNCFFEWQYYQKQFKTYRIETAAKHGTHSKYVSGCRCYLCCVANTEYGRLYRERNK